MNYNDLKQETDYNANLKLINKRFNRISKFIKSINGNVLDIGNRNDFGTYLAKTKNLTYYHTGTQDLNYKLELDMKCFDNIFCFDVLEHLVNPLLFIENLKQYCNANTKIIVSVPRKKFKWMWAKIHWHEFDDKRFNLLINIAGYNIIKGESFIARSSWKQFIGFWIRPYLRLLMFWIFPPKSHLYLLKYSP